MQIADQGLNSHLFLGTARYPSPDGLQQAVKASGTEVVTVSLRRELAGNQEGGVKFLSFIKELGCNLLPNTAGCRTAEEAITTAQMARELLGTHWVKVEVIGDDYTLQPNPFELVKAVKVLIEEGFEVFPYCTDDLVLCQRLVELGCNLLMPWAAPIGSGQGILNPFALRTLRERLPETLLVVDAGIGAPSQAAAVMEMGYDAVLVNTAVALAADPVEMARAFRWAVEAGRAAYSSGLIPKRDMAVPSTPTVGQPFCSEKNAISS